MSDECDSLRYMRKIARANFSNDSGLDLRTPQLLLCDFSTDSYLPKPNCPPMCVHAHACARGWHQVFFLRSCRLDWPRIQWFPCACLLSAGIKGACLHCLACELTFIRHVLWLFFFWCSDIQKYFYVSAVSFFFRSMWVKTALCPLPVSACWAAARATFSLLCLPATSKGRVASCLVPLCGLSGLHHPFIRVLTGVGQDSVGLQQPGFSGGVASLVHLHTHWPPSCVTDISGTFCRRAFVLAGPASNVFSDGCVPSSPSPLTCFSSALL